MKQSYNLGKKYFYPMQIKSRILLLVTVLLLATAAAVSLLTLEVFGKHPESFEVPVPNDAEWLVRVDAFTFVKEELYTLLVDSKDDQVVHTIEELVKNKLKSSKEDHALAIDFRHDFVLYGTHSKKAAFVGILVEVSDPELFLENIPHYLKKGQVAAVNGHTALILTHSNKARVTRVNMQRLADSYLENGKKRTFDREADPSELIHLEARKAGMGTGAGSLSVGIRHNRHSIELNGKMELEKGSQYFSPYTLKSSGLFISTSIVPKRLTDTLNKFLPIGSYHFPELRSVTFDYQGSVIDQGSMGLMLAPKINMIIESTLPVSIDSILASLPETMIGEKVNGNHTIKMAQLTYELKLLDAKTLFIGIDPSTVQHQAQPSVFSVNGDLSRLTDISGSQFILAFLEVIPPFRFGKAFVESTTKVDFIVAPLKGDTYTISGTVRFKDEVYPLHEITKLLIGLELLDKIK